MDSGFLSFAILIEIIVLLAVWIGFIHWRLLKKKKELLAAGAVEEVDPLDVYLQYINRELSETKSHLDDLFENSADDVEAINMYEYRLRHLNAEQKAMTEAKGDTVKFWEYYRSNIEFVYSEEPDNNEQAAISEVDEASIEVVEETSEQPEVPESMVDQLGQYKDSSQSIIEQSNNVIELIRKIADKDDSEELAHLLGILTSERDELASLLQQMEEEYARLMGNAAISGKASELRAESEGGEMSKVISKQNSRVTELNDIVGDLSIELEDKKRLLKETQWVTRQLKETEQVVVILEDENNFLRGQIQQLVKE